MEAVGHLTAGSRRAVGQEVELVGHRNRGSDLHREQGYRHSWAVGTVRREAAVHTKAAAGHKEAVGRKAAAGRKRAAVHIGTAEAVRMEVAGHTMIAEREAVDDCRNPGHHIGHHSCPGGYPGDSLDGTESQLTIPRMLGKVMQNTSSGSEYTLLAGILLLTTSSVTILSG